MADIDSNSLNNFVTALNKASKSLGDMQKAMDATTKSTQNAGKAADGATKEAAKEAAKPSQADKTVGSATQKIKDDFAKDVMAAFNADGKAARTARIKARDDLYGNLKHGVADTTTAALGDAASTGYRGSNDYVLAFLRGYAKTPGAASDKAGAAAGAKTGAADATADAGKTEDGVAKSTDFMVGLAEQAGERIRGSLGSMLFDTLDGNFKNVGKSFRTMLRQMVADIAASQISKLAGTALSWIGGAIGGLFGNGSTALPGYSPLTGGGVGNYGASIFFDGPMAAEGMALQSGTQLRAFARGGIVSSPTLFPMATGTGHGEQGQYDVVSIIEAPDETAVAAFGLSLAGAGNVRSQTLRAFTKDEMEKILAKVV